MFVCLFVCLCYHTMRCPSEGFGSESDGLTPLKQRPSDTLQPSGAWIRFGSEGGTLGAFDTLRVQQFHGGGDHTWRLLGCKTCTGFFREGLPLATHAKACARKAARKSAQLTQAAADQASGTCLPTQASVDEERNPTLPDDVQFAIDGIRGLAVNSYAGMHVESYMSQADIQRSKRFQHSVGGLQRDAIKAALDGIETQMPHIIDAIMNALDPLQTASAEEKARVSEFGKVPLEPQRESLGTIKEMIDVGGERGKIVQEREAFVYHIPIEQSLQRRLVYDKDFSKWLVDVDEARTKQQLSTPNDPLAERIYTGALDGDGIRGHPMLKPREEAAGARQLPRLAFELYCDDVSKQHHTCP